jgi:DNA polymerase-3 subunit gamma/tau
MQCASCVGITQGNALDVIEFDAASNNGVGDARELIENCQYSSMTGRFKVYIIDEVHMLTPQAFNALLKTLEEPPANVIFIFATTEAHKVLPTIISRCQRFDFNRITTENIINRLHFIAQQEHIAIDEDALLMIARHARGGLRDAVGLLDQVAVLGRAQQDRIIGRKDVAMFIGTLEEDLLLRLGSAIAERRAADLLTELNELLNRGIEPIQLLKDLTLHFRNLLLVKTAGANVNPDMLSLPPDYYQQLANQAQLFPAPEEIPQIIGRLSGVERHIRNSTQPQLWLEVGLIELAYRHEIHLVSELSERVARLEAQLSGQVPVVPSQSVAPARTSAKPVPSVAVSAPNTNPPVQATPEPIGAIADRLPLDIPPVATKPAVPVVSAQAQDAGSTGNANLEANYAKVCAAIPSLMFRSLVQQQTFPISMDGDVLTIGCVGEPNMTTLKKADKFIHLQKAVDKVFGRPLRLDVVLEKKRPAGSGVANAAVSSAPVKSEASPQPESYSKVATIPHLETMGGADSLSSVAGMPLELAPSKALTGLTVDTRPGPVASVAETAFTEPLPSSQEGRNNLAGMSLDEPPPLEDDGPFMEDDEDGPPSEALSVAAPILGGDPNLSEAKKHAVELLQGRILE